MSATHPSRTLYYVHDPMCSWCYAFRPLWQQILQELPAGIVVKYIAGGLAPDSSAPMPEAMQTGLINTWQHITQVVPGTRFNFDFWTNNQPRRSTYPACRAILAVREQDTGKERAMISAIQDAYYQRALNPSDDSTLIQLATELGLDGARFAKTLNSGQTLAALQQEISFARSIGGDSFPSLILQTGGPHSPKHRVLMLSYTDKEKIVSQL